MIQVQVQIWNKKLWKVFDRQDLSGAAPWYTDYSKLEYTGHGVSKVCEHVGREASKAAE